MTTEKKGLAALTPEQRVEIAKKAQETRKAGAEARKQMIASGVDLKSPIKAIRAKCLDCCGGQYSEVVKCTIPKCPLFPYRFGKRPRDINDIIGITEQEQEMEETTDENLEEIDLEEDEP